MGFTNTFRISTHAVITDEESNVLLIRQTYGDRRWGLPGGSPESSETIHDTLFCECREELGCDVVIEYLGGVHFHSEFNSYAFIFRCRLRPNCKIALSTEHSQYKFANLTELSAVQRCRIEDCLNFDGTVKSAVF